MTSVPKSPRHLFGRGICNANQTCYLNSVIQLLFHVPGLVEAIEVAQHKGVCSGTETCVFCALKAAISLYYHTDLDFIDMSALRAVLSTHNFEFRENHPADIAEALYLLLDSLPPEIVRDYFLITDSNWTCGSCGTNQLGNPICVPAVPITSFDDGRRPLCDLERVAAELDPLRCTSCGRKETPRLRNPRSIFFCIPGASSTQPALNLPDSMIFGGQKYTIHSLASHLAGHYEAWVAGLGHFNDSVAENFESDQLGRVIEAGGIPALVVYRAAPSESLTSISTSETKTEPDSGTTTSPSAFGKLPQWVFDLAKNPDYRESAKPSRGPMQSTTKQQYKQYSNGNIFRHQISNLFHPYHDYYSYSYNPSFPNR
ncbi:hypothetical protein Pelo_136 [Pelomyxa schiedti]|nr:hypothetical protein Pelo_136 [Pelomyxa schiedti]